MDTIQVLYGTKHLEPVRYSVVGGKLALPWWKFWGPREEWHVESEFMKLGPFATRMEAEWHRYGLTMGDPGPAMAFDPPLTEWYDSDPGRHQGGFR